MASVVERQREPPWGYVYSGELLFLSLSYLKYLSSIYLLLFIVFCMGVFVFSRFGMCEWAVCMLYKYFFPSFYHLDRAAQFCFYMFLYVLSESQENMFRYHFYPNIKNGIDVYVWHFHKICTSVNFPLPYNSTFYFRVFL